LPIVNDCRTLQAPIELKTTAFNHSLLQLQLEGQLPK